MPLVLAAGSMLDHSPTTMIDAAAAAGFDGVGLRISNPAAASHSVGDVAAVRRHAHDSGIAVHDVEVVRIGTDHEAGALVERAAEIGAASLLVVSDASDRADTVAGVAALVELARPLGVEVALEYMAWTDPTGPLDAVTVARQTGCRVVVDVLHHVRVGATVDDLRAVVESGTLGWLQICDAQLQPPADLIHEARHRRLAPGDGGLPLAELLSCISPHVTVSVEVQNDALAKVEPHDRAAMLHTATRAVLDGH